MNYFSPTQLSLQIMHIRPHVLSYFKCISLGYIIPSKTALTMLSKMDMMVALMRHATCDWGYVTNDTWLANTNALVNSKPVFSTHYSKSGIQFFVITEGDRSVTMIELAQD